MASGALRKLSCGRKVYLHGRGFPGSPPILFLCISDAGCDAVVPGAVLVGAGALMLRMELMDPKGPVASISMVCFLSRTLPLPVAVCHTLLSC